MKAVMIVYNHGISEEVFDALEILGIKGFTRWSNVHGQGTNKGEPRMGTHIWPSQNVVLLTVVEDEKVDPLLEKVKSINEEAEEQGIHAFVYNVEKMV